MFPLSTNSSRNSNSLCHSVTVAPFVLFLPFSNDQEQACH